MIRVALVLTLAACGSSSDGSGAGDAQPPRDGAELTADAGSCSALPATIRDFHVAHPDFEHYTTDMVQPGIVLPQLGADRTPTYAAAGATASTSGPANFAQWYHDVQDVNVAIPITITLDPIGGGTYVYDNSAFFPIDNQGFGNESFDHNYSFTTEIHTSFVYAGAEHFTFRGDDDVWMFVNGRLAIDLGGLHQPAEATADLDTLATTLGITPGGTYTMDIFHAERHSVMSNFRIETTIGCFIIQ